MFSPLRNRFGIPGVISVIALVFAMMGGAYAATDNGGHATASAKAKKGPRGPKGPAGPAGAAGAQGPAGPAGPAGPKGDTGPKGDKGDTGAQGPAGKNGTNGKEGSPWTAGGTLPPKKTETGTWSFGQGLGASRSIRVPISFSIPLVAPLGSSQVHYINSAGSEVVEGTEQPSTTCHGTPANPTADPGNLCVYVGFEKEFVFASIFPSQTSMEDGGNAGASTAGAVVNVFTLPSEESEGWGTWAVTAEEE